MLVIATNTQTGWLYVVVGILVALLLVGFTVSRLTLRGLHVTRGEIPPVWEGERVTVRLFVSNPSRWSRYMVALSDPAPGVESSCTPQQFVIGQIPAGGVVNVEYGLPCPRRGAFAFGRVKLNSATPFGLFPAERGIDAPGELVVYPRGPILRRLDRMDVLPRSASASRTFHRAGHSYDFQGIREYRWGDDIRFVHWPTTARLGQLTLREFQEMASHHITIVIDNGLTSGVGPPGATPLDDATRMAASVIAFVQRGAARVSLAAAGMERVRNVREPLALEWLARLQPAPALLHQHAPTRVEAGRSLIVFAVDPPCDESVEWLLQVRERVSQLLVVLLEADSYGAKDEGLTNPACSAAASRLSANGIMVRRHWAGRDLALALRDGEWVLA